MLTKQAPVDEMLLSGRPARAARLISTRVVRLHSVDSQSPSALSCSRITRFDHSCTWHEFGARHFNPLVTNSALTSRRGRYHRDHDTRHGPLTYVRHARYSTSQSAAQPRPAPVAPSSEEPTSIGVVGGGITGLATAYYALKLHPRARVTVYESTPRFGGWLHSTSVPLPGSSGEAVLFESGPRSLRPSGVGALGLSLATDLGLRDEIITTSKKAPAALSRYVYYPDRLVRIPAPGTKGWVGNLVRALVREPVFKGLLGGAAGEGARRGRAEQVRDQSVGEFLSRRLGGHGVVDRLVSAVFHGVYAGDVWRLSARSLMAGLWKAEGESGGLLRHALRNWRRGKEGRTLAPSAEARMIVEQRLRELPALDPEMKARMDGTSVYTFRKGLGQLSDTLVEYLRKDASVEFKGSTAVTKVARAEGGGVQIDVVDAKSADGGIRKSAEHSHLIWTASPNKLLDKDGQTQLAPEDFRIPTVAVMTVNLYFKTPNLTPPGFGHLIPLATSRQHNPDKALGVVFDDSYSPDPSRDDPEIIGPQQDHVAERGTKLTVMIGGHHWEDRTSYPTEEEGLEMALRTLRIQLGIEAKPLVWRVNIQKECIPQYTVGHHDRLSAVHELVKRRHNGRVRCAGNYIHGVGVNDSLFSALETVSSLAIPGRTGLDLSLDMIGGRAVVGSDADGQPTIVRTTTWKEQQEI